ncbi:hypothetical protein TGVAND_464982, partial [Toxoplasma gondii VAND]
LSSLPLSSSSPCSPASPLSSSGGLPVICPCCSGRRAEREEQAHKLLSALFFCQDAEQTDDSRVGRSRTSALREAPGGESAPPPPAFEGDPERGRERERERGGDRVAWRSCGYPDEERVFFFAAHRPGSDCIVCCVWAKQRSEAKGCCCKRRNALEAVTLLDSALEEAEEQEEEEREEEDSAKGIAEATETVADQRLSERRPADSQAFSPSLPDAWCSGRAERRCTYTREAGSPEAEAGPEAERQREGERGEETEARDERGVCSEEGRTDRRKEGRGERVADATAACSQEGSCCTHHMQEQRWSLRLDEKQREERVSALVSGQNDKGVALGRRQGTQRDIENRDRKQTRRENRRGEKTAGERHGNSFLCFFFSFGYPFSRTLRLTFSSVSTGEGETISVFGSKFSRCTYTR